MLSQFPKTKKVWKTNLDRRTDKQTDCNKVYSLDPYSRFKFAGEN